MTIQWDFKDAEPWHLKIDNGSTERRPGRVEDADLVLRCRFEDWADISAGRTDPRMAMATGKLRPKGGVKQLLRMQKMFGPTARSQLNYERRGSGEPLVLVHGIGCHWHRSSRCSTGSRASAR